MPLSLLTLPSEMDPLALEPAVAIAPQPIDSAELISSAAEAPAERVRLFGMAIHQLTLGAAAEQLLDWCRTDQTSCRYVVTPNVDHVVMHHHRADLRGAYEKAALVVADGAPLIAASRLLGKPLPERVAGSDLVPHLFSAAQQRGGQPLRLFLLGAGPGVAERAAANVHERWPLVKCVGTYCPPLGFEHDEAENQRILAAIAAARPDVLVIGLGAPKQELWVSRFHEQIAARVALCAGATIDFLAGEKKRSPRWMQRMGLEWAHRLLSEPRRLAGRYSRDAWIFPQLVWRELRRTPHEAPSRP
ncbi:WecB/TagA/CpsF family glycosyltransferase [Botrimarina hoheduenensis]|uniref:Putative N-acetylmannosaminyltransferase n=1 Tax=Botrimarina hoheduenensis TaxID=2528000 RepID=A0A5C5WDN8_9BACT|nr:WecB/TagA/CpsF family glycosyltransferase [Botrimarina hoheduenensis]TWT48750.1 putative N-acetylmannosaminyltransferase [Botrimarina hoheduenensis]